MRFWMAVLLWAGMTGSLGCSGCDLVVNLGDAGGGAGGGGGVDPDAGHCLDRDNDGYGTGDCLGADCDDTNPTITTAAVIACFSFDAGLLGRGICKAGTAKCTEGAFASCLNEVGPRGERCNGEDDDCNKLVDDNVPAKDCYTGAPVVIGDGGLKGVCKMGRTGCVDGGETCIGEVTPAPVEICGNGKDDNCNGSVDEPGCALGTYVCGGCLNAKETNPGTQALPVMTIGRGILHALALGMPTVFVASTVNAAEAAYPEDLTIPDGVVVQGRWAVAGNTWVHGGAPRAAIINTSTNGLRFAPGAGRGTGLDGVSIQAVVNPAVARASGITILNASPLLKDFEVLAAGGLMAPETIAVDVRGVLAFPRLEGTVGRNSEVTAGPGNTSVGVRVSTARIEIQYVKVKAGRGSLGSFAVHLLGAPQSVIRDSSLVAGLANTCIGLLSQGAAGALVIERVSARGCPDQTAGAITLALTGAGMVFEACPKLSGLGPAQVRDSTATGGMTTGPKSLSVGAAAVDGCDVTFSGSTFTGGVASNTNTPESQIGLSCGFQSLTNVAGADAPCKVINNQINAGLAASPNSVGLSCSGGCSTMTAACLGSCQEIRENTIIAPAGSVRVHLAITDSSPLISRNRIGSSDSSLSPCAADTVLGVRLEGSSSTVVNNFICAGPCKVAIGIHQINQPRSGDSSIAGPTVHFNTIVASCSAPTPLGAVSIGVQLSTPAAAPGPRGIWRSNIIVAGPVAGPNSSEIAVREADSRSDPAIFWNNLLHVGTMQLPALYVNEGTTPISTEAGVNGISETSSQGNLYAFPAFVAPTIGDYHLTQTSPARENGGANSAPAQDIDAEARPNPTNTNPDIGADEVF